MLTVFSFKLALLQIIPYLYFIQHDTDKHFLTSSYSEVESVTRISSATVRLPYWTTDIRILHNDTSQFVLVDLPESIPLCVMLGYFTKLLPCVTPYTVSTNDFKLHQQYDLIKGIFSLNTFDVSSGDDFLALLLSNNYGEAYITQSFPSLTVNMSQPLYAEDVCKVENGCRLHADWASFVGLSVRDTLVTFGVHYGAPVAMRTLVNSWRVASGSLDLSGIGLWGRANVLATTPIFPATVSEASSIYELAPMAAQPISALSGIVTQTTLQPQRVITSMRGYASLPNMVTYGAELAATRAGASALETLSTSGSIAAKVSWTTRLVRVLSSLRLRRSLNQGNKQHTVTDNNTDITTNHRTRRGFWSANTRIITAIPSWVTPSVLSGILTTIHGIDNLKTVALKVKAFYPIVPLTVLEKFYATSAALILNKCFDNSTLRELLIESSPMFNSTILSFAGRDYKPIDVVFNFREMRAGPILHACTPMFKLPFSGLSKNMVVRSLSLVFSPEIIVNDIMYYDGLPQYIRPDIAAYINDIIPRFQPLVSFTHIGTNIDDYRFKRRVARATTVIPPAEYGQILMGKEPTYTNAVQNMIAHPNARYSFDIMTIQHLRRLLPWCEVLSARAGIYASKSTHPF